MTAMKSDLVIIIDDREWVPEVLRNIVGHRRFGDITLRRRKLYHTLVDSLPKPMQDDVFHLTQNDDCKALHDLFSASKTRISAFIISTRAAFPDSSELEKLVCGYLMPMKILRTSVFSRFWPIFMTCMISLKCGICFHVRQ